MVGSNINKPFTFFIVIIQSNLDNFVIIDYEC